MRTNGRASDGTSVGINAGRDVDGEHRRVGRNRRDDVSRALAQTARAADPDDAIDNEVGIQHRINIFDATTCGFQRGKPRDVC